MCQALSARVAQERLKSANAKARQQHHSTELQQQQQQMAAAQQGVAAAAKLAARTVGGLNDGPGRLLPELLNQAERGALLEEIGLAVAGEQQWCHEPGPALQQLLVAIEGAVHQLGDTAPELLRAQTRSEPLIRWANGEPMSRRCDNAKCRNGLLLRVTYICSSPDQPSMLAHYDSPDAHEGWAVPAADGDAVASWADFRCCREEMLPAGAVSVVVWFCSVRERTRRCQELQLPPTVTEQQMRQCESSWIEAVGGAAAGLETVGIGTVDHFLEPSLFEVACAGQQAPGWSSGSEDGSAALCAVQRCVSRVVAELSFTQPMRRSRILVNQWTEQMTAMLCSQEGVTLAAVLVLSSLSENENVYAIPNRLLLLQGGVDAQVVQQWLYGEPMVVVIWHLDKQRLQNPAAGVGAALRAFEEEIVLEQPAPMTTVTGEPGSRLVSVQFQLPSHIECMSQCELSGDETEIELEMRLKLGVSESRIVKLPFACAGEMRGAFHKKHKQLRV